MSRSIVRRARAVDASPTSESGPWPLLLGLSLGVAAGFLLGELVGPLASRAVHDRPIAGRGPRASQVRQLVAAAQAALDDDLMLRDCHLRVIPIGPGRIELHGWVADRRSRGRAGRLVGDAVHADAIVNCLQVRGEDDIPPSHDDDTSDERLA
ncbi:MAG TPA: hypothetical protein VGM77_12795 [Gemmatimonadales bacterium]